MQVDAVGTMYWEAIKNKKGFPMKDILKMVVAGFIVMLPFYATVVYVVTNYCN